MNAAGERAKGNSHGYTAEHILDDASELVIS